MCRMKGSIFVDNDYGFKSYKSRMKRRGRLEGLCLGYALGMFVILVAFYCHFVLF